MEPRNYAALNSWLIKTEVIVHDSVQRLMNKFEAILPDDRKRAVITSERLNALRSVRSNHRGRVNFGEK